MKTNRKQIHAHRKGHWTLDPGPSTLPPRHGGAVLIVVISLMGSLAFLGFLFYSLTGQSEKSAAAYNEQPDGILDPDPVNDHALQQILVSTDEHLEHSALWGNMWSLLAHTVGPIAAVDEDANGNNILDPGEDIYPNGKLDFAGFPTDVNPHSGTGIRIFPAADGDGDGIPDSSNFDIDYNGDGVPDANQGDWGVNYGGAAQTTGPGAGQHIDLSIPANQAFVFSADAGYTYPDLNAFFLSYETTLSEDQDGDSFLDPGEDLNGNGALDLELRVFLPSYFRPTLFPGRRSVGGFDDVFRLAATADQVLRPHREHVHRDATSFAPLDPRRFRFLRRQTVAQSGDQNRVIPAFSPGDPWPGFDITPPPPLPSRDMGLYTGSDTYDLDRDVDNDGRPDSILMDLDHPMIDLADGRQAVPLYAIKIVDLDGLLDVNTAGNGNDLTTGLGHPFGNGQPISASNLGTTHTEVNPLWALRAVPTSTRYLANSHIPYAMDEHGAYFGFNPSAFYTGAPTVGQLMTTANMELGFLLFGQPLGGSGLALDGRWGESAILLGGGTPLPGTTGVDDDLDSNASSGGANARPYGGYPYSDNDLLGLWTAPFVHPLDYRGVGDDYLDRTTTPGEAGVRDLNSPLPNNNPSAWPFYGNTVPTAWQEQVNLAAPTTHGVIPWRAAAGGQLQPGAVDQLRDEGDEVILDPNVPVGDDAPFAPSEVAGLLLSDADWRSSGGASRLRELMPFNLERNREAAAIRAQLTCASRDRLEFSHSLLIGDTTVGTPWNRSWEFAVWTNPSPNPNIAGYFNTFEDANFNGVLDPGEDVNGNGQLDQEFVFPPQFGVAAGTAQDPFRPEVRRLLRTPLGGTNNVGSTNGLLGRLFARHRLNINRLLANDRNPAALSHLSAFDADGNPLFRNLTPHPDLTASGLVGQPVPAMIHDNNQNPPVAVAFANVAADPITQEWWARYDRQRLARDIYVLLYTLGGPDNVDPTSAPYPVDVDANNNSISDLVDQMAQFAVNYVDALDRDNVVTQFAYDGDLSNGWDAPNEIANGIEAQQLTFSEVLWVINGLETADTPETLWQDDDAAHQFLYIELRNATPFDVPLNDDTWRIVREPLIPANSPAMTPVAELEFLDPAQDVGPGQNFIIAMHDNSTGMEVPAGGPDAGKLRSATFHVDYDMDSDFDAVVPYRLPDNDPSLPTNASMDHPAPLADLDVSYVNAGSDHSNHFNLTPLTTALGPATFVEADGGAASFDLVLQRRRHLQSEGAIAQGLSDWIEVDRINVEAQNFNSTAASLPTELGMNVRSRERYEPFHPHRPEPTHMASALRSHTIGGPGLRTNPVDPATDPDDHRANSVLQAAGNDFTIYQPHFDRDFSSPYELLSVPRFGVRGADNTTDDWDSFYFGGATRNLARSVGSGQAPKPSGESSAGTMFTRPDGDLDGDGTPDDANGNGNNEWRNRWYRLFEYLDVPPRSLDVVRNDLSLVRRTPGRINLNTMRHDAVFAGLIDDPQIRRFTGLPDFQTTFPTDDAFTGTRNWFRWLQVSRDGLDFVSGVPLPGVPGARPFRAMSYIDPVDPDSSIQDTILRRLPDEFTAPPALQEFGLFEARSTTDVTSDTHAVDFHTRERLLAKIANNSTNRSHVFAIWLSFELFEAHQPTGASSAQIGARIEGIPRHREFIVVDMSRLEEAYDPVTTTYDFRKFIIHRQRIQ